MTDMTDPFALFNLDGTVCVESDVINAHHRLIRKHHTDVGGSDEAAATLNVARDEALKLVRQRAAKETDDPTAHGSPEKPAEPMDDGQPEWAATSTSFAAPGAPKVPRRWRVGIPSHLPPMVWAPQVLAVALACLPWIPNATRVLLLAAFALRAVNGFLTGGRR